MGLINKKNLPSMTLLVMSLLMSFSVLSDTSKELLVSAIAESNSLKNNLSIEQRLVRYEEIQRLVDDIIVRHPGSDEAISLISEQKIGNFDFPKIKRNHLSELTQYYKKVCKVAPSFNCIALVSLDNGNKACRQATTVGALISAQSNIKNALLILQSQGADRGHINLAQSSYRSCPAISKVSLNNSDQDYLSSQLIDLYIELGDTDQARAVIQRISNPYYKFAGVLTLQRFNGTVDRAYINRMDTYIEQKIPSSLKGLASNRLQLEVLSQQNYALRGDDLDFDVRGDDMGSLAIALQLVDAAVASLQRPEFKSLSKKSLKTKFNEIGEMNSTKYGKIFALYKMAMLIDKNEAQRLLSISAQNGYASESAFNYIFTLQETNSDFDNRFVNSLYDDFFNVKRMVRAGDMCGAVKTIFTNFVGTTDYERAIKYLIESPRVDRSKEYNCGDADLEMLLGMTPDNVDFKYNNYRGRRNA